MIGIGEHLYIEPRSSNTKRGLKMINSASRSSDLR